MAAKSVNKKLLIEAVPKIPCLYDTTKKEYKDELARENAWKSVCSEVLKNEYQNETEFAEGNSFSVSFVDLLWFFEVGLVL